MTEESDIESTTSEKLLVDDRTDFQFHAAYLKYSNAYDNATDPQIKKQLNHNIICLQQNQIDYATFYKNINQCRAESPQERYRRTRIKTQRKREWRRKTKKRIRAKRHKK